MQSFFLYILCSYIYIFCVRAMTCWIVWHTLTLPRMKIHISKYSDLREYFCELCFFFLLNFKSSLQCCIIQSFLEYICTFVLLWTKFHLLFHHFNISYLRTYSSLLLRLLYNINIYPVHIYSHPFIFYHMK